MATFTAARESRNCSTLRAPMMGAVTAGCAPTHATAVAGLVLGGLIAAPFAGVVARLAPRRALTYGVGAVVLLSAGYQALRLFKLI